VTNRRAVLDRLAKEAEAESARNRRIDAGEVAGPSSIRAALRFEAAVAEMVKRVVFRSPPPTQKGSEPR